MVHNKLKSISIETIEGTGTHAIYKARADVNEVVKHCGYSSLLLGSRSPVGFFRVLKRYYDIYTLKFRLRKADRVFFQFPWIHNNKPEFYASLFGNGTRRIQCIIHDLDSLRGIERKDHNELADLSRFHSIIAHTPAMKQFLVEQGIDENKISILYLFPYLTEAPLVNTEQIKTPTVVFAGNLAKSTFVEHLPEIADNHLRFNVYGKGLAQPFSSDYVKYKGIFEPDYPVMEGNWGLVWDGPVLNTCSGLLGDYLRYNSSHKISLYLALGIPVIIWEQSSLKDFITQRHLGIAVRSLQELPEVLHSLSAEDLHKFRSAAGRFSATIRSGEMLKGMIDCQI